MRFINSSSSKTEEATNKYSVGQRFKNKLGTVISIFDVDPRFISFHMISKNGVKDSWNNSIKSFDNMLAFNGYAKM